MATSNATSIKLTDKTAFSVGSYLAYITPWGNGSAIQGVDYTESMTVTSDLFPNSVNLTWSWPVTVVTGVKSFLAIDYGDYDYTTVAAPIVSSQIKSISSLSATTNFTMSGLTSGFDVVYDMFLTAKTGSTSTHLDELEIFLHTPSYSQAWIQTLKQVGSFTSSGITWNVAIAAGTTNDIIITPSGNTDITASSIDVKSMFNFLVSKGVLTGNEYFNGMAVGAETASGAGSVNISNFAVQYNSGISAPTVTSQTGTQTWKLGQAVSFGLPTNTFTDPQGQKLTYSATQANGAALPSWLTFNATTGTFSGTVPNTAAGLSIKVTATDTSGLSTSETFSVLTPATAPTLAAQTPLQTWKLGQAVNFALPTGTFKDPQGEALTYSATLSTGAALPSWLTFNKTTGTFTGTVPNTAAGLSIKVTATDTSGLSTSENFSILTPATAPSLVTQTANQTWKLGQAVSFALPSTTFKDPQGEALTYSATLSTGAALPSWLTFNKTTGTFTGTVPNTAAGLSIKVTATDTSGLSTSENFSVLTPAAAPTAVNLTKAQGLTEGKAFSFTLATNTFSDPQGETLTYTATQANGSALPSWLSFNKTTETFSGTAPTSASTLSLKVTATDTSGLSVAETFSAVVTTASLLAQAIASAPASTAVTSALTQLASAPPTTLAASHQS